MTNKNTKPDLSELMDMAAVCERLGMCRQTIHRWIADPTSDFPKGAKLGTGRNSPRRWLRSDIENWLEVSNEDIF